MEIKIIHLLDTIWGHHSVITQSSSISHTSNGITTYKLKYKGVPSLSLRSHIHKLIKRWEVIKLNSPLEIYIPKLEDYWYEQKIQSDPDTMSYNAGWNVSYEGYHCDTGCIDFPKDKWEYTFNKRIKENKFFAYLKDTSINEYVGYINYHYNKYEDKYYCGILIESKHRGKGYSKVGLRLLCSYAKEHGVKELYDDFESDRNGIKVFEDLGFKIVDKYNTKRFEKNVEIVVVKKILCFIQQNEKMYRN